MAVNAPTKASLGVVPLHEAIEKVTVERSKQRYERPDRTSGHVLDLWRAHHLQTVIHSAKSGVDVRRDGDPEVLRCTAPLLTYVTLDVAPEQTRWIRFRSKRSKRCPGLKS